jgi:hypothetical protein
MAAAVSATVRSSSGRRALAEVGDTDRAVRTLLQAERVGPERVHKSPLARETVRGLVEQTRRRDQPALTGLAERLNVSTD